MKNPKPRKDSVFALIEAQEAAERAHNAACAAYMRHEDAGNLAAARRGEAAANRADLVCSKTMKKLCRTRPKTLAGAAAMAKYIGRRYDCEFRDKRTQQIFATLAAAIMDLDRKGPAR